LIHIRLDDAFSKSQLSTTEFEASTLNIRDRSLAFRNHALLEPIVNKLYDPSDDHGVEECVHLFHGTRTDSLVRFMENGVVPSQRCNPFSLLHTRVLHVQRPAAGLRASATCVSRTGPSGPHLRPAIQPGSRGAPRRDRAGRRAPGVPSSLVHPPPVQRRLRPHPPGLGRVLRSDMAPIL
jgi:hypothetical protein